MQYLRRRIVFSGLAILFAALLAVVLHSPTQALAGGEETISLEMPTSVPTGGAPIRMVFRVHNPSNSTFFFDGYIRVPNDAARTDGSLYVPSTSNSDLYWMDCYRDYGCNLYWRGQLESDGVAELVVETKSGNQAGTYEFVLADFHTTIRGTEVFPLIRNLTLTTAPTATATAQPTGTATVTHAPTPAPSATPTNTVAPTVTTTPQFPVNNHIDWNTNTVSLHADNFYILADGKLFTAQTADLQIHSDPGWETYTTLEAIWHEQGVEMRLFIYFGVHSGTWWMDETRTYNGRNPGDWIYFAPVGGNSTGFPLIASTFENVVRTNPAFPDVVPGTVHFDGLRLQPFFRQSTPTSTATPTRTSTPTATNTTVPTATALPSATVTPTNVPNPVAVSAYSENNKVIIQGTNLAAAVMVNAEIRFYRGSDTFGFQPINSLATGVVWDYNRIEAPLPPTVDNVTLDVSFWAYTTNWNLYRSNKVALVPPPGPTLKSAYRRPSDGAIVLEGAHVYERRQTSAQFLYDNGWYAYGAEDATTGSVWSANQAVIPAPPTGHIPLSFSGKVRLFRDGVESNFVSVPAYSPTQPSATPTSTNTPTATNTAVSTATLVATGTATRTPSATATLAPTATATRSLPTPSVAPSTTPTVLPTVTPTPQIIRILFAPVGENEVQIVSVVDYNLLAACYEYQLGQQNPEAVLLQGNTMSAEEFLALVKSLGQPVAVEATSVRI